MRILLVLLVATITLNLKAQVKIEGVVKNCKDSIFYITETGGFHNFTRVWRDRRVKVTVDKNHRFKTIIPEESIGAWCIKTEQETQIFHIAQGKDLELIVDFSKSKPLFAIGKNADDFNYFAFLDDSITKYYSDQKYLEKVKNANLDSILIYRKRFSTYKQNLLRDYRANHKMTDAYYKWLQSKYIYEPYERTLVENLKNKDSLDNASISKIMQQGINDEYAALNTTEYNDLVDFFVASKLRETNNNLTLTQRFNFIADTTILTGSTKQVYLSRFMAWLIKSPDSIYNPIFMKYDKIVHDKKMKQSVIDRRNDYSTSFVTNTKVLSIIDILKKYRGNVIYIDFWASWCIPCRIEMPNAAMLKEKFHEKKIVFLYFGYNDREKAWVKARDQLNIEGEHYLLDEKMIKEADKLFGINGIPHYAIIDKNGNIINKQANPPGKVYQELFDLLKN